MDIQLAYKDNPRGETSNASRVTAEYCLFVLRQELEGEDLKRFEKIYPTLVAELPTDRFPNTKVRVEENSSPIFVFNRDNRQYRVSLCPLQGFMMKIAVGQKEEVRSMRAREAIYAVSVIRDGLSLRDTWRFADVLDRLEKAAANVVVYFKKPTIDNLIYPEFIKIRNFEDFIDKLDPPSIINSYLGSSQNSFSFTKNIPAGGWKITHPKSPGYKLSP